MPYINSRQEIAVTVLPCKKEVVTDKKKFFYWFKIHKKKCEKCKNFCVEDELYKSHHYERIFNDNNITVREKFN